MAEMEVPRKSRKLWQRWRWNGDCYISFVPLIQNDLLVIYSLLARFPLLCVILQLVVLPCELAEHAFQYFACSAAVALAGDWSGGKWYGWRNPSGWTSRLFFPGCVGWDFLHHNLGFSDPSCAFLSIAPWLCCDQWRSHMGRKGMPSGLWPEVSHWLLFSKPSASLRRKASTRLLVGCLWMHLK